MPVTRGASVVGKCSACGLVFYLVPSSGVLRRHGFGGSFPPCEGAGVLPSSNSGDDAGSVDDFDMGMCSSPSSALSSESNSIESSESFPISSPSFKLVKRIPRSARHKAATVFESCLRDVINVGSLSHWERLFGFAAALRQPSSSREVGVLISLLEL